MSKQEAGNWAPYNTKSIVDNVKLVFKTGDINKLNGTAYKFITLHMGFIAHYDLYGFRDSYQDLNQLAKTLQTSEYSDNSNHNLEWANKCEADGDFSKWYGAAYNKSVANTIRGIVAAAREHRSLAGMQAKYGTTRTYSVKASPKPRKKRSSNPLLGGTR
jgi:hypothetical protein